MADCNKCPVPDECRMINASLNKQGVVPSTLTFCPLKYAVESAGNKLMTYREETPRHLKRWTR